MDARQGVVAVSTRKKWSTIVPPHGQRKQHRSKTATYEWILERAKDFAVGMWGPSSVVVYIDEGDGHGWQRYELVDLREYRNHPAVMALISSDGES